MKSVIQRVSRASVEVDGDVVGSINKGLLVFVGFGRDDSEQVLAPYAKKVSEMRLFPDEQGRFHFSALDCAGEVLLISQFTLFADCKKGRRPDFFGALEPEKAKLYYEKLAIEFETLGIKKVAKGVFGAHMLVDSVNDGPVTIPLDFPLDR